MKLGAVRKAKSPVQGSCDESRSVVLKTLELM
jgi:hypothetical protein